VETQYKNYDSRINITDVQGKDKMNYAMIYDSNDQLVAQCKNAESGSVAYSSFELGNHGYWNGINPSFIQPFGGLTGKKYYSQNSFSISKPGLSITSEYIVTYWSKNGPYNVSGTQAGFPKVLRTLDHSGSNWTLFEHIVSNQSIITVSGSGAIDELRLMPREAEMTTYNYEPSVGLTSQCNKNGQLIFYEYDSAGRLSVVKDEKLNILKTYEYKFGQSQSY
jgi:hypothetical protein